MFLIETILNKNLLSLKSIFFVICSFSNRLSRFLSKESDGMCTGAFTQSFIVLMSFLEYVAVHCTHGVNRTGYLICR